MNLWGGCFYHTDFCVHLICIDVIGIDVKLNVCLTLYRLLINNEMCRLVQAGAMRHGRYISV